MSPSEAHANACPIRISRARWSGLLRWPFRSALEEGSPALSQSSPYRIAATISSSAPARTRRLARAVAQELNDTSVVVDCLRWKRNLGSASEEGGPRDPKILYDNVTVLKDLLKDVDKSRAVLLTDDVITSGGHLRASAARLRGLGLPVGAASAAARHCTIRTNMPLRSSKRPSTTLSRSEFAA